MEPKKGTNCVKDDPNNNAYCVGNDLNTKIYSDIISSGAIITCRVAAPCNEKDGFLKLRKFQKKLLRLRLCEVSDCNDWETNPFQSLKPGKFVRVVVLKSIHNQRDVDMVDVSMRSSLLEKKLENKNSIALFDLELELRDSLRFPEKNTLVKGFVERVDPKVGVFIRISRCISGIVPLKYLADKFVVDVAKEFKFGMLVAGRVIESDPKAGKVVLSLRSSSVIRNGGLSVSNLKAGMRVDGIVNNIVSFGVFIQLKGFDNLSGLCHNTELSDNESPDVIRERYKRGDLVRVYIVFVEKSDEGKMKISLSLKQSHFLDEPRPSDSSECVNEEEDCATEENDESDDNDESVDSDSSDNEDQIELTQEIECDETMSDEEEAEGINCKTLSLQAALEIVKPGKRPHVDMDKNNVSADELDCSDDSESGEGKKTLALKSSKARARKRRLIEAETMAKEEDMLKDDNTPSSAEDYERLILGAPNSSMLWIQYMSFQAASMEFSQARIIAERALQAINFRQEEEKENIWLVYIQLENQYGGPDSVEKLVKRMLSQVTNRKKALLRLAGIYETENNFEKADDVIRKAIKEKKGESKKAWLRRIEIHFKHGKIDKATSLLQDAVRAVPEKKKTFLVLQFARLEYTLTEQGGSAERARTMCEDLLSRFPKRNDIWLQYIHMEIKFNGADQKMRVDSLFDRAIAVKFSLKKIRAFFKEWLKFANDHGTNDHAEEVKIRARAYVEALGSDVL